MNRLRAVLAKKSVWFWAAEVAGVVALSVGAWMIYEPAAVIVVGAWLIILGNSELPIEEGTNARDRES